MKKGKNCDGSGIAIDLDTSTECPYCDGKGYFDLEVNIEAKEFRKSIDSTVPKSYQT